MAAHRVGTVDELRSAGRIVVDLAGRSIGVFAVNGSFYALRNLCAHQGGPLCEGKVLPALKAVVDERRRPREYLDEEHPVIACPWHGVEFDLATGACLANPMMRVASYPTRVEGHDVFVDVDR